MILMEYTFHPETIKEQKNEIKGEWEKKSNCFPFCGTMLSPFVMMVM